ncbi:RCC1/BLIP-II protein [Obba rivulosa]|uniref:RCC1/BLIP-II protein n=1 Tax=Obba rivulosa TaxID=1052685 RepID=A0A8E2DTN4_9APHY|nr:RCC1/BLIP-II protein [Obba rivulosa]
MDGQSPDSVRIPAVAEWLDNVALRDISLHEKHAACVDARGDVYQWGDGFFGDNAGSSSGKPALTLRGKDIVRIQVTPTRVFALSKSGNIYVISSSSAEQTRPAAAKRSAGSSWWGSGWFAGDNSSVDFAEIVPNEKLNGGEKFVAIAAGSDHLLALTSSGRTFAHAASLNANSYGQLGFRKLDIPTPATSDASSRTSLELTPKAIADPYSQSTPAIRRRAPEAEKHEGSGKIDDSSIRFSDKLFEVPALKGIQIDQIAAGSRSSFAKTPSGRVLGWGANEYGQLGLGSTTLLDTVIVPTEVILWRATPSRMQTKCTDVFAGGNLTFFKVERTDGSAIPTVDVLSCGNGQFGGLGNALYNNAQGTPVRSKNVSGILEYSEKTKNLQPVEPHDISISPTGHVLLTLDTLTEAGPGAGGRDVLAWGANYEYQLGNGRRGSLATPTTMQTAGGGRFMLRKRKANEVRDLRGNVWKRGVEVEQCAVAGWGNSMVYWKVCS